LESSINNGLEITRQDLFNLFVMKYGNPETTGWSPRRRLGFNYFHPAEYYEALVGGLVSKSTDWIDVGGGQSLFPSNASLAQTLSRRARRLVGVDPSENISANPYLHERMQCRIEDYQTDARFDLATLRMVAEHITEPRRLIRSLQRLLCPGGLVVILTPYLWSPSTMMSRLLPFTLHAPIVRFFWGADDDDVFPTVYQMNTRKQLAGLFKDSGFQEQYFAYLDDLAIFGRFKRLSYLELLLRSALQKLHIRYPETCLLAVYQRGET
jgi:SAM-dependent methyltransferase